MKVIITTAGRGSRISGKTDILNKALIKVGDKAMINHIIDSYPATTKFVIVLGYKGDQVMDYILLCYPDHNIEFVRVDLTKKQSMLYSLVTAIKESADPYSAFIYNACDMFVPDAHTLWGHYTDTLMFGSTLMDNVMYDCVDSNGKLQYKGHKGYPYLGVCYVVKTATFVENAEIILELCGESERNDFSVFKKSNTDIRHIKKDLWYDIGNIHAWRESDAKMGRTFFTSEKIDRETYFIEGHVIKFLKNEEDIDELYQRRSQFNYTDIVMGQFIKMDFVHGVSADLKCDRQVMNFIINHLKNKVQVDYKFNHFYTRKTLDRVGKFLTDNNDYNLINGERIKEPIQDMINACGRALGLTAIIGAHGDFVLSNVIVKGDGIHYIDIRTDFGGNDYGALEYEWAKLSHSLLFNHKKISLGEYNFNELDDECYVDITVSYNNLLFLEMVRESIPENQRTTVEILHAFVWLSMSPLHPCVEGKILYALGKLKLYQCYNILNAET